MRVGDLDAVFFDFDGVILESVDVKTRAFRQIYEQRAPHIADEVERFHLENGGMSRFDKFRHWEEQLLARPLTAEGLEALCEQFSALVFEGVCSSPFVQGADGLLERLRGRVPLHVVSATPHDEIGRIVDQIGLSETFESVNGSPTTKTEWLRTLLERGALDPERTLMVGDASADHSAAVENDVPFVGRCHRGEPAPFSPDECVAVVDDLDTLSLLISD